MMAMRVGRARGGGQYDGHACCESKEGLITVGCIHPLAPSWALPA